jgi:hypothetical protein
MPKQRGEADKDQGDKLESLVDRAASGSSSSPRRSDESVEEGDAAPVRDDDESDDEEDEDEEDEDEENDDAP